MFMLSMAIMGLAISYTIFINVINVYYLKNMTFTFDFSLLFFRGNRMIFVISTITGILPLMYFGVCRIIDRLSFGDGLEKKDYNRLMKKSEAKRKYLPITFRGRRIRYRLSFRIQLMLNPAKKAAADAIDKICDNLPALSFLRRLKPRTRKRYSIGGQETPVRAGFPVIGTKKTIWVDPSDSHSLIVGTTNSGKTISMLLPFINLVCMTGESGVIVDLKGELSQMTYDYFVEAGYRVWILDFINPECSNGWNPLALATKYYMEENQRLEKLHDELTNKLNLKKKQYKLIYGSLDGFNPDIEMGYDRKGNPNCVNGEIMTYPDYSRTNEIVESVADGICIEMVEHPDFWDKMAAAVLKGLIYFLLENGDPELVSLPSAKYLFDVGMMPTRQPSKMDPNPPCYLQHYVDSSRKPTDLSYPFLKNFLDGAQDTRKSIRNSLDAAINPFLFSQQVKNILASNDINLPDIDSKKTVIFLKVHDEKSTYYPLVNVFMNQLQQSLIEQAREREDLYLSHPFNFLWDEFGQFPRYNPVFSLLGAGRSRGIRLHLVVQGYDQLDRKYGKEGARSIRNGCVNKAYLLSDDEDTLKTISNAVGEKLIFDEKGQKKTEPILTTEKLRKFRYGDVLVLRQKELPFMSKMLPDFKYDYYSRRRHVFEETSNPQAKLYDIKENYENDMKKLYR